MTVRGLVLPPPASRSLVCVSNTREGRRKGEIKGGRKDDQLQLDACKPKEA